MNAHPEPLPLPPAPSRLPRPRAGLLIAVLLLSFVLGLAWLVAGQWQSESSRAALEDLRARSVRLHHLDTLLLQMLDAESSVRGYLLTQNPAYLTPYQDGQADLERTLGALLTAAKLDAGWIARKLPAEAVAPLRSRFDRLLDTLNQGIALKRKVVADLRPPLLSELGLIEALRALPDSGDIGEHGGRLEIELPDALPDVPAQTALALYRIAQEALTNARRYAQARSVRLRLRIEGDELLLAVEDDGVGFDPAAREHNRHGLAGMAHRVQMLAGRLEIDSAPGKGTRISARVPFARMH
jgi:protein-histidine pros-kinase